MHEEYEVKLFLTMIFATFFFSCSSWDPKTVTQIDGKNYFIKKNIEKCSDWKQQLNEISNLTAGIHLKSLDLAAKCISEDKKYDLKKLDSEKDALLQLYKNLLQESDFQKHKFDNCFGTSASNFLNSLLVYSYNSYLNAKYYCSSEVYSAFEQSSSPKIFERKFKEILSNDYNTLAEIDRYMEQKK